MIGWFTVIDGALVMRQIYNISDDARTDGQMAPHMFYIVSYLCWLPFLVATVAYINYKRKDSEEARNLYLKANTCVLIGVIALYTWFLLYFLNVGETDLMQKDLIVLIVLMFASP